MTIEVRRATLDDLPALARLDLHYPRRRLLALQRSGTPPEETFELGWRDADLPDEIYATYTEEGMRRGLGRADLFLVSIADGAPVGLLQILLPTYTNAGEITDLAVHRPLRGHGAGSALVHAALVWARDRGLRSLWVEPRSDNADAIEFYLSLGFRISGFNDRMYSNSDHEDGRLTIFIHLDVREP